MLKKFLLLVILLQTGFAYANSVEVTPVEKISTSSKKFSIGNKYDFKDVKTGEIYTGEVTYYKPNGLAGQEAQFELGNFKNSKGELISGVITVIPSNHKTYQEYANFFVDSCSVWIRGSEAIILPEKHRFIINNNKDTKRYLINIKPKSPISTAYDEIEYGDIIEFKTITDVYKNGKLFIKADTSIYGEVDYLDENGWAGDNAKIYIKNFRTKNTDNKDIIITSDLIINGFELLKYKSKRTAQFFNYLSSPIRGKEIDIKEYDKDVFFTVVVNE